VADDLVIDLRNVCKSYGEGRVRTPVLREVSFEVRKGEFVALIGQSGSGKSTLLNIIGGLDRPDSGQVSVLGKDYAKISESDLARLRNTAIGFVFQSFNLLDHLTCLGNVTLPAVFAQSTSTVNERGLESLRRVGMADLANRKPSELSGGQKQRVAIARALFNDPALLLCDEPTGNLDSETGREVIEFFQRLNADDRTTLLIVTHEERVSSAAKRISRISDGQLAESGGPSALATGGAA
jgi:putative ABC transport system ATP-binding protein